MRVLANWLWLLLLFSCTRADTPSDIQILARGVVTNSRYSNSYFGLNVIIPRNWIILREQETTARNKMGLDLLSKSHDISDSVTNKKPKFLLNINKYRSEALEALQGNCGFQISFLKHVYFPHDSGLTFLDRARAILKSSPYYKSISEIHETSIGGRRFYVFESELHFKGYVVQQKNCIIDTNDCFLFIDTSYRGDFVKPELERIIRSISFD